MQPSIRITQANVRTGLLLQFNFVVASFEWEEIWEGYDETLCQNMVSGLSVVLRLSTIMHGRNAAQNRELFAN